MSPEHLLDEVPLVAILRGVTFDRIVAIGEILFAAGIRAIEVPLNSPDPFDSIARLTRALGALCLCGAGTVTTIADVDRAADAGADLIVAPNTNAALIAHAVARKLVVMPGFMTASEAFAAYQAGATRLKLFPAASCGPAHLQALKAVLPPAVRTYAVGGVDTSDFATWRAVGVTGFGIGSDLFKPNYTDEEIARRAHKIVAALASAVK